jgi:hypothetical protein
MSNPALVTLAGLRGFALGEHGSAGSECRDLHGELLHVPWLLRVPDALEGLPSRFTGLTGPPDLSATLLDWFGLEARGDGISLLDTETLHLSNLRQVAIARDVKGHWVVRTPAWMLRQKESVNNCPHPPQLYAKPDDRWEVNDVANLCPRITEGLLAVLAECRRRLSASTALEPLEIDSEFITPQR